MIAVPAICVWRPRKGIYICPPSKILASPSTFWRPCPPTGLRKADADPGASHSARAEGPRPHRSRPDRHRQDGRLRPADDRKARLPTASAPTRATSAPWCWRRPANWSTRSPRTSSVFVKKTPLKIGVVVGGVSINKQTEQLARGVDILVATPGRLLDLIDSQGRDADPGVAILVLDEADQMLDLGFIHDLRKISQARAEEPPDAAVLGDDAEADRRTRRRISDRPGQGSRSRLRARPPTRSNSMFISSPARTRRRRILKKTADRQSGSACR